MWMSTSEILSSIHLISSSNWWRRRRESAFISWYCTRNLQDFPISWLASPELSTFGGRLWKSLVTSIPKNQVYLLLNSVKMFLLNSTVMPLLLSDSEALEKSSDQKLELEVKENNGLTIVQKQWKIITDLQLYRFKLNLCSPNAAHDKDSGIVTY